MFDKKYVVPKQRTGQNNDRGFKTGQNGQQKIMGILRPVKFVLKR